MKDADKRETPTSENGDMEQQENQESLQGDSSLQSEKVEDTPSKAPKKKKGPLGVIIRILLILVLIILIPLLIGLVGSLFDGTHAEKRMPQDFQAYLKIDSVEELTSEIIDLEAVDMMVASPQWGALREQIIDLRKQELWSDPWFQRLIQVEVTAAMYPSDEILLAVDLGWRSAPLRVLRPLADKIPIPMDELSIIQGKPYLMMIYQGKPLEEGGPTPPPMYLAYQGNLLLMSSSQTLLENSFDNSLPKIHQISSWKDLPSAPRGSDLRVILKSQSFVDQWGSMEGIPPGLMDLIEFPDYAALDLSISEKEIFLQLSLPVSSDDSGIQELLETQSGVPAIVSDLSDQVEYATLLALGEPAELMNQLSSLMTEDAERTLNQADQAARLALGMDLEELIFSWVGREWGVFGLKDYPEPVFFVRISDEKKRQEVFEDLFSNFLLNQQDSLVIDNLRISQMTLPWYLRSLLQVFKVDLPEPFFVVEKDFIYFSNSAEALAKNILASRQGDLLVKTENWKEFSSSLPPAASVELFYSLNRSLPFFLQGDGQIQEALSLYRRGIATLRFEGDRLILGLSAQGGQSGELSAYPGYPMSRTRNLKTPVIQVQAPGESPRLYWIEGSSRLIEYQPASGEILQAELDDQSWLFPHPVDDSLWVVSERGAIYRYKRGLTLMEGYPQITGHRLSTAPTPWGEGLYLPLKEDNRLLYWENAMEREVTRFNSPLLSPVSTHPQGIIAAYPKSFLGEIHLIQADGSPMEGWPVEVDEISYASPFFIPRGESYMVGFLTQAGGLTLYTTRGEIIKEMELDGVFYQNAQWAESSRLIYALSEDGVLFQADLNGRIRQKRLTQISGKDAQIVLLDLNGDRQEEILIARAAGVLYAYKKDFSEMPFFPIAGGWDPILVDLNGDGSEEILTGGFDKTIRAYRNP